MDCPAGVMWADVLTKPLQGTEFRKIGDQLMNCAIKYKDEEESATKTLSNHRDMGLSMQKYIRIM